MALDATIGGAAADTYVTLAEYTARAAAMGWGLAETDAENEVNLRRAAVVLDVSYVFRGVKNTADQAREWPRFEEIAYAPGGTFDPYYIRSSEIPGRVKDAQMEMAYLIQQGADPLATFEGAIKRERIGPLETEYTGGAGRPRYDAVDRILRDYIMGGPGQARLVRG